MTGRSTSPDDDAPIWRPAGRYWWCVGGCFTAGLAGELLDETYDDAIPTQEA